MATSITMFSILSKNVTSSLLKYESSSYYIAHFYVCSLLVDLLDFCWISLIRNICPALHPSKRIVKLWRSTVDNDLLGNSNTFIYFKCKSNVKCYLGQWYSTSIINCAFRLNTYWQALQGLKKKFCHRYSLTFQ